MTHLRELPELVRDSELGVTIHDNITVHTEPLECRDSFLPQRWETRKTIGRGGDGTVFLQRKISGPGATDLIAVKQMSLNAELASEDHDSKRYVRELEALAKFAQGRYSRWFVRSYGWYQDDGWLYICMEYCKHLDLGKHLKAHGSLSEEHVRVVALQVLQGLFRMHGNKIAHRDLKPANILIHRKPPEDDAWWVVLGDLGLSRRSGASSGTTTIRGTPSFMAPETIGAPFMGLPRDADPFSADMWCLGESIACALTGQRTFSDNEHLLRYQKRQTSFPDTLLKTLSASIDAIDFIRSLMEVDPLQRLTAKQALSHRWITVDHVSRTHTTDTDVAILAPSAISNTQIVTTTSDGDDQTTEVAAQWTQTIPVLSESTQASAAWTATIADPAISRHSPDHLDHPTIRQHSTEDTTAQTKEVLNPGQTEERNSSNNTGTVLSQGFRDPDDVVEQSPSNKLENHKSIIDSFKQFSAAEKLRLSDRQRVIARENKAVNLADLKKFAQNFKLTTPIPKDLVPILSKDEDRQAQLVAAARQRASIYDLETARKHDSNTIVILKRQDPAPIKAKKTPPASQQHIYGNAVLPPPRNPSSRPPPEARRPLPASNLAPFHRRPSLQPQTKAASENRPQAPTVVQTTKASRWEEAVRRQEAIAQSLVQTPKAAVASSSIVEEPQTQVLGRNKKKKKGGE